MSFIVCVSTRIQIATLKWIVPNIIAALRKALGSKKYGAKRKNWEISLHNYWLRLHTLRFLNNLSTFSTRHTCALSRIEKHLYMPRCALRKILQRLMRNISLLWHITMFTDILHAVLFFHDAALLEKSWSFDGIDWFWYIIESLWTFSNLQGAPLPALPLPPFIRQTFCTYIYAVKWNIDQANEINKTWLKSLWTRFSSHKYEKSQTNQPVIIMINYY